MFNASEETPVTEEEQPVGVPEVGQVEEQLGWGEEEEDWGALPEVPVWRRRRFLLVAGVVVGLLVCGVLGVVLLTAGSEASSGAGAGDDGFVFEVEQVQGSDAAEGSELASLAEAIGALTPLERVELLQELGFSEEEAAVAAVSADRPWRLNPGASETPTDMKSWERFALTSGALSGLESEGGLTLGLVAQDVLASLGPAVWPMVQADQMLRRIFTQSLVDWDYWGTKGELLVLESYLQAASEASQDVERRVAEANFGLSAQTRNYVEETLAGLEPLRRGRDIAVEVNEAFGDGRGWDSLDPSERSRLGRKAGQEIFEELSAFDRVMIRYGCSVCGELYRNPPEVSPTSAVPASGFGAWAYGRG